jgi:fructose-1,6-bisphosphatase I / sedoheptulose-1,7-bisphosphatase
MPLSQRTTLTQFLIEERRRYPAASGDFNALMLDVALACKAIARAVAFGELGGAMGNQVEEGALAGSVNVQGETQKKLDVISNQMFMRANEWGGHLAGMASEEMEHPFNIPAQFPRGKYLLVFDPLDGSSNIDVNVSVGSIFSILRAPQDVIDSGRDVVEADFLQPGTQQMAAGYALYGPTTMLVLTVGTGVYGFTLDPNLGEFKLTHPQIRLTRTLRSSPSTRPTAVSGKRRSSAMWTNAWPVVPVLGVRTSTCAGSPPWWPRRIAS